MTSHNVVKCTFWHVRQMKTQISLRIRTVWSEFSFSAWMHFSSLAIQNAPSDDSDQTARMRGLIWIIAGRRFPEILFWRCGSDVYEGLFLLFDLLISINPNICLHTRHVFLYHYLYYLSRKLRWWTDFFFFFFFFFLQFCPLHIELNYISSVLKHFYHLRKKRGFNMSYIFWSFEITELVWIIWKQNIVIHGLGGMSSFALCITVHEQSIKSVFFLFFFCFFFVLFFYFYFTCCLLPKVLKSFQFVITIAEACVKCCKSAVKRLPILHIICSQRCCR